MIFVPMKNSRRFWSWAVGLLALAALGTGAWFGWKLATEKPPEAPSSWTEREGPRPRPAHDGMVDRPQGPARAASKARLADSEQAAAEPNRPAFQFDRKGVKVDPWVAEVQALRGASLTSAEREAALAFLAGEQVPEGIGKGSMQWLSDELLTALRLQDLPWKGLAAALAEAAFQPTTDPVVRDYIMQHLGHWWEQNGAQPEIETALWRGVETADSTTPGTSLIALNNGYQRDGRADDLARVREKALELAGSPNATLAVRSTALSIATEGGGKESRELAARLAGEESTPLILRKVAEHALKP